MFTLDDVDKRNFNAVLRRSLVWRVKARSEDPRLKSLNLRMLILTRMASFPRIWTCRLS